MRPALRTALTIAGSDPSGGAGIQGDLKTFVRHGVYGMAALTALTVQNTQGVRAVHDVPPAFVAAQLDAIFDDLEVHAAKTGMVSVVPTIEAIAGVLARRGAPPLVVDPVMVATSGDPLLDDAAVATLVARLFPLAAVVTPNLPEAERLCGFAIESESHMERADRAGAGRPQRMFHLHRLERKQRLTADDPLTFTHQHRMHAAGHRRLERVRSVFVVVEVERRRREARREHVPPAQHEGASRLLEVTRMLALTVELTREPALAEHGV